MSLFTWISGFRKRSVPKAKDSGGFLELLEKEHQESTEFCFLQVGANDGVKFDELHVFVTTHKCRGVVVEPLKFYFSSLDKNYAGHPDITPLNCAVHASESRTTMYHVDPAKLGFMPEWAPGIGSLDSEHHRKSNTPSEFMITEEVECMHLMEIIEQHNLSNLSLLQVDVEGYDGEVIRMINFDRVQPRIIKYEHLNLPAVEQKAVTRLLKSNDYSIQQLESDTLAILEKSD